MEFCSRYQRVNHRTSISVIINDLRFLDEGIGGFLVILMHESIKRNVMLKNIKQLLVIVTGLLLAFALKGQTSGYYDDAVGLEGVELRMALH